MWKRFGAQQVKPANVPNTAPSTQPHEASATESAATGLNDDRKSKLKAAGLELGSTEPRSASHTKARQRPAKLQGRRTCSSHGHNKRVGNKSTARPRRSALPSPSPPYHPASSLGDQNPPWRDRTLLAQHRQPSPQGWDSSDRGWLLEGLLWGELTVAIACFGDFSSALTTTKLLLLPPPPPTTLKGGAPGAETREHRRGSGPEHRHG